MGKSFNTGLLTNGIAQDSSNNIGIGGAANASYKLAVTGASLFTGAGTFNNAVSLVSSAPTLNLSSTSATGINEIYFNRNTSSLIGYMAVGVNSTITGSGDEFIIDNRASGGGLIFRTNNAGTSAARMTITASGNVGIGTSSPNSRLQVGDGTQTPINGASNKINIATTGTRSALLTLANSSGGTAVEGQFESSAETGDLRIIIGSSSNHDVTFRTNNTERMRITSGGNVGIGIVPQSWSSSYKSLQVSNASLLNDIGANTYLGNNTYVGTDGQWKYSITAGASIMGLETNSWVFYNAGSGSANANISWTERMRITSGGDLLVGKSSTNWTLPGLQTEANATNLGITCPNSSNNLFLRKNDSTGLMIQFWYNNSSVGSVSISTSSTSYNTSSDYRLKEDLKEINGLQKVSAIKVYDFQWKSDKTRMDGVLAHELAEVLPYAVYGQKDGEEMQGVDYSKIVPVLVKAIQELSAKVTALESKS